MEGLYKNFGDTAKLRDLIALKKKYFYRLFVDETFSFGCFGRGESWFLGPAPTRSPRMSANSRPVVQRTFSSMWLSVHHLR